LPDIPRDEPDVIIPLKLLLDNCMLRTKLVHRMARKLELFLLGDPEVGPPVAKDKPTHYEIKSLITEYRMPLPKPATGTFNQSRVEGAAS
jgi:hypothetical protein